MSIGLVDIHVKNCFFIDVVGSAIQVLSYSALVVTGSSFVRGAGDGSAIYASSSNVTIIDSRFEESRAAGSGGALIFVQCETDIISSTFEVNTAKSDGGSIYQYGGTLDISDTTFRDGRAGRGGHIYLNYVRPAHFNRLIFEGVNADIQGGSLLIDDSVVYITDCAFSYAHSVLSGGFIHIQDESRVYIQGTSFLEGGSRTGATDSFRGGVIGCYSDSLVELLHVTADKIVIAGEPTSGIPATGVNGAFLYSAWCLVVMDHVTVTNSKAIGGSGGVLAGHLTDGSEINSCVFKNNKASWGGVFALLDTTPFLFIVNNVFENNEANMAGAVYFIDSVELEPEAIPQIPHRDNNTYINNHGTAPADRDDYVHGAPMKVLLEASALRVKVNSGVMVSSAPMANIDDSFGRWFTSESEIQVSLHYVAGSSRLLSQDDPRPIIEPTMSGDTSSITSSAYVAFWQLIITGTPGSYGTYWMEMDFVMPASMEKHIRNIKSQFFNITIRPCITGERMTNISCDVCTPV
jgi:hypothetical protein